MVIIEDINSYKDIWRETLSKVQLSISKTHFKAWFSNSTLERIEESEVIVAAKNNIAREYFENEFFQIIKTALEETLNRKIVLRIVVVQNQKKTTNEDEPPPLFSGEKNLAIIDKDRLEEQFLQSIRLLGLNRNYSFENYVVGESNRLAYASCFAVAENPGYAYNPLFIYGDVGLGKTHLIQAVANHILKKDPSFKIIYTSSEVFLNEMIMSIRSGNPDSFRKKYRQKSMLIIDDIQFIESKKGTQEEIFHTFNSMYQFNKQIIIVSDKPPEKMPFLEERLRSRFEGGMVADINKPEYETRLAILIKKCEEKSYDIDIKVLEFVAKKFATNVRELEGALVKINGVSRLNKKKVELGDVGYIFTHKHQTKRNANPVDILNYVAKQYKISVDEITGSIRKEKVVYARQIAMYLLRKELRIPLNEVAHILNRKDHTTVIHAIDKIEVLVQKNADTKNDIDLIMEKMK